MNRSGSAEARTIGIYNCDNVRKCVPSEVILTYERRNTFVGPRDYSNAVMTIILGYQNIIAKRNRHRPKVNWQCRRCRRAHCHDYASTSLKLHDGNFLGWETGMTQVLATSGCERLHDSLGAALILPKRWYFLTEKCELRTRPSQVTRSLKHDHLKAYIEDSKQPYRTLAFWSGMVIGSEELLTNL